ncbi:hypothetical protein Q7C36_008037 [Tachysurus vachellii]|uniref:Uncharacterized protein n=1 Tax=Tachysurus vachellii TaxID=175792 RepID=A0AA88N9S3_TACVA|nr:hypothetical protein Q7C36_008037 [Tachysurus vachellii]
MVSVWPWIMPHCEREFGDLAMPGPTGRAHISLSPSRCRTQANPVQVVRINPVSRPQATPELLQVGGGDRWGPRCRGLQGAERLASQHGHTPTHTHSDIRLPQRAGLNIAARSGVQGKGHEKESLCPFSQTFSDVDVTVRAVSRQKAAETETAVAAASPECQWSPSYLRVTGHRCLACSTFKLQVFNSRYKPRLFPHYTRSARYPSAKPNLSAAALLSLFLE